MAFAASVLAESSAPSAAATAAEAASMALVGDVGTRTGDEGKMEVSAAVAAVPKGRAHVAAAPGAAALGFRGGPPGEARA